ncbi:hypothetical protein WJX82_009687 [Trebouxia sp. C0006]
MPPPWWPPAVSFEVFTKKTQDELVVLLLALMDHTRVELGLLDDFKRALRGARRKFNNKDFESLQQMLYRSEHQPDKETARTDNRSDRSTQCNLTKR